MYITYGGTPYGPCAPSCITPRYTPLSLYLSKTVGLTTPYNTLITLHYPLRVYRSVHPDILPLYTVYRGVTGYRKVHVSFGDTLRLHYTSHYTSHYKGSYLTYLTYLTYPLDTTVTLCYARTHTRAGTIPKAITLV